MKNWFLILVLSLVANLLAAQPPRLVIPPNHFGVLQNVSFAEMELEDTSGQMISTASLKGKTIYVDFWFTQCPPCIREIPYARDLQSFFAADTSIVFLNICIENIERKQAWKDMVKDKRLAASMYFMHVIAHKRLTCYALSV
ncbi:TlpA family protein disulfide reductase [Aridibaculum aurantiacum]|uniref:TlpA family protein disulfide reductase n=1 Tax=Aridibaculum aurantiacum TaxID=2810307 RepID=UPI001A96BE98|nr:redoxin family protein [Aridibaculum aurantiacum]